MKSTFSTKESVTLTNFVLTPLFQNKAEIQKMKIFQNYSQINIFQGQKNLQYSVNPLLNFTCLMKLLELFFFLSFSLLLPADFTVQSFDQQDKISSNIIFYIHQNVWSNYFKNLFFCLAFLVSNSAFARAEA